MPSKSLGGVKGFLIFRLTMTLLLLWKGFGDHTSELGWADAIGRVAEDVICRDALAKPLLLSL